MERHASIAELRSFIQEHYLKNKRPLYFTHLGGVVYTTTQIHGAVRGFDGSDKSENKQVQNELLRIRDQIVALGGSMISVVNNQTYIKLETYLIEVLPQMSEEYAYLTHMALDEIGHAKVNGSFDFDRIRDMDYRESFLHGELKDISPDERLKYPIKKVLAAATGDSQGTIGKTFLALSKGMGEQNLVPHDGKWLNLIVDETNNQTLREALETYAIGDEANNCILQLLSYIPQDWY